MDGEMHATDSPQDADAVMDRQRDSAVLPLVTVVVNSAGKMAAIPYDCNLSLKLCGTGRARLI
jgi:hypothetical protein